MSIQNVDAAQADRYGIQNGGQWFYVTFDEIPSFLTDKVAAAQELRQLLQKWEGSGRNGLEHWDEVTAVQNTDPDDPDFINPPRPQDLAYDTIYKIDPTDNSWSLWDGIGYVRYYWVKQGPPPLVYRVARVITVVDCVWVPELLPVANFVCTFRDTPS